MENKLQELTNKLYEEGLAKGRSDAGLKSPIRRIKRKRSPDVKVLSEQIIKLLDSKTLALQLGRKARKRFLENYALEVFKKKMMSVYEALLN